MRFRMLIFIVGAIAIAIVAAGCGGSGSTSGGTASEGTTAEGTTAEGKAAEGGGSSTTATSEEGGESKPMTKTEFHTRINEICIQVPPTFEEELKKLEKGGKKPSKAETNLKAAIPPLESSIEQMEDVIPPPNEEQLLKEVIAALESAVKGIEEKPTSELSGPKSPFAEFQKVTKENEFETCSGL